MVDMTFSEMKCAEKLSLAARLVEEVAYELAGIQTKEKVAHLILVAASLERLANTTPGLVPVSSDV